MTMKRGMFRLGTPHIPHRRTLPCKRGGTGGGSMAQAASDSASAGRPRIMSDAFSAIISTVA